MTSTVALAELPRTSPPSHRLSLAGARLRDQAHHALPRRGSSSRTCTGHASEILTVSRRNNAAVSITGVLLQHGRRFLQVLEGDPDGVAATVVRIEQDPRHIALVRLAEREIEAREFGDWSMASDRDLPSVQVLTQIDRLTQNANPYVHALFMSFATMQIFV